MERAFPRKLRIPRYIRQLNTRAIIGTLPTRIAKSFHRDGKPKFRAIDTIELREMVGNLKIK